jgi:spore coat protein CotF
MCDVRKYAMATTTAAQVKIRNRLDGHLSRLARNSSISVDAHPVQ